MAAKEHDLDGIVSAAKKDPRFEKMRGRKADADEHEDEDGADVCPKCGHRSDHE